MSSQQVRTSGAQNQNRYGINVSKNIISSERTEGLEIGGGRCEENDEWVSKMQVRNNKHRHDDIRIKRKKKPVSLIRKVQAIAVSNYTNSIS